MLPVGTIIWNLLRNPAYLLCVIAMTNMMFILTAQQYWASDYMIVVLGGEREHVYILFVIAILSAPCFGAVTGGIITTKLGGYTSKRALLICFVMFCFLIIACLPMSFVDSEYLFVAFVWCIIFTQGFIEPVFTGILLNTVAAPERSTASSLSIFIEMVFGLLPAPYAYGLISRLTKDIDVDGDNISRWGMRVVSLSSVIGGLSLMLALILRSRSYKQSVSRFKSSMMLTHPQLTQDQVLALINNRETAPEQKLQSIVLYSMIK